MLIDTHAHLEMEQFEGDLETVIKRASGQGVKNIINVGSSIEGSESALEIAKKHAPYIICSVGVHPHDAESINKKSLLALKEMAQNPEVVAIGEIGLDYYVPPPGLPLSREVIEKQKLAFIEQLHLAAELSKPVIIHCRDAYEDTAEILEEFANEMKSKYELRGVVHSWGGNWEQAEQFLNLGLMLGFTANITYKNVKKEIEEVIVNVPLDRFVVETDAPFLAPQVWRGTRNEPSYVGEVAKQIAFYKGLNFEEMEISSTKNAELLFGLE